MTEHSISLYQAKYTTSIVEKYMDNYTVKTSKTFYKTTFPSYMIFTKDDASNSDEKVENLTTKLNINCGACTGS